MYNLGAGFLNIANKINCSTTREIEFWLVQKIYQATTINMPLRY